MIFYMFRTVLGCFWHNDFAKTSQKSTPQKATLNNFIAHLKGSQTKLSSEICSDRRHNEGKSIILKGINGIN